MRPAGSGIRGGFCDLGDRAVEHCETDRNIFPGGSGGNDAGGLFFLLDGAQLEGIFDLFLYFYGHFHCYLACSIYVYETGCEQNKF